MRLINVKAFLEREQVMSMGGQVDCRFKVLDFGDDETTAYTILSHRWIDSTEVDYEEMVDLTKMGSEARDEIRGRLGYKKILDSCRQAMRDRYEWLWVDTCCIDKRSSAELSEAINSMYRWYGNARVCYAYLHDVLASSFPAASDESRYCNGWPEWFSRGWTLQEMIAPRDVRFFNKDWHPIGDKRSFARTLRKITGVPQHILEEGLSANRPCVAQIISWAANRTTTRVEDRAYSLMGLLDVNMPMLYGEGKKAFHRLQLEIIRISNDQSIFAWGCRKVNVRSGSILADDPNFFGDCAEMELINPDKFIANLKKTVLEEGLRMPSIDGDCFGTFPITNRGIQIWMLLRPYRDSNSVFEAWLPCRYFSSSAPVRIDLALWNSNYYRYSSVSQRPRARTLQFCQIYLRYQDAYQDVIFEIDDSTITENGFICNDAHSSQLPGTTLTLTCTSSPCVKVYFNSQAGYRFVVALGQCFGQDWIHVVNNPRSELSWFDLQELMAKGPERAESMAEAPSRYDHYGRIWVNHICLPGSSWIVRTSRVVWERSRIGVRIEVFRDPAFNSGLDEWRILHVQVGSFLVVPASCFYHYDHLGNK